jgi:hypothetical protein
MREREEGIAIENRIITREETRIKMRKVQKTTIERFRKLRLVRCE